LKLGAENLWIGYWVMEVLLLCVMFWVLIFLVCFSMLLCSTVCFMFS